MKKTLTMILAFALVFALGVGGTLAWLTASTGEVVNTFTTSNIDITLAEGENLDLKMVPGKIITKDPVVTVLEGSEKCYLFVKVTKSANFDNFMTYSMVSGWTETSTGSGIFYRVVDASTANQPFGIILNDEVTVKTTVDKVMMDAIENSEATAPTLTFDAYAHQFEHTTEAAAIEAAIAHFA